MKEKFHDNIPAFVIDHLNSLTALLQGPLGDEWDIPIPRGASSVQRALVDEIRKQFKASNSSLDSISFQKVYKTLQKATQALFVNSYQSYVWNSAAEVRLKSEYQSFAKPGDLVLVNHAGTPQSAWHVAEQNIIMNADHIGIWNATAQESFYFYHKVGSSDKLYPIESVIIPLPGEETCITDEVKSILENDGMNNLLSSGKKSSAIRLPGAYRHLLTSPLNIRYRFGNGNNYWSHWNELHLEEKSINHFKNFRFGRDIEESFSSGIMETLLDHIDETSPDGKLSSELTSSQLVDYMNAKGNVENRVLPAERSLLNSETSSHIQLGFSLCSSAYATVYIDNILARRSNL